MAELEVLKHTKKAITVMKSEGSWWHKIKEIITEILIIVFAVSLSIWLHGRSELSHDRHDARLFLEGLKTDLQHDISEMQGDLFMYKMVVKGVAYFETVAFGEPLNRDSLEKYKIILYNTTIFNPNESRFEGLKATGRLNIIENKPLLDNILYFYQEDVKALNLLNELFTNYKINRISPMIDQTLVVDKTGTGNWQQVLQQPVFRNALQRANTAISIVKQYERTIRMAMEIVSGIEKELD